MKSKQYKHRQKKKKERQKRQQLPNIKIGIYADNQQFKDDFNNAINEASIAESFWKAVPVSWRKAVVDYRNHLIKFKRHEHKFFRLVGSSTLCKIIQQVTTDRYPRYKAYNYSIDVTSARLHNYIIYLETLKTKSTSRGLIHLLPDFRYPSNKKLGLTTHAVEQMDARLFDDVVSSQATVLRAPTFLIPYKHNIFALYTAREADGYNTFNGIPATYYMLLGYLPVEDYGELLVGITHLKPGYRQTPEQHVPEDKIINSRILVIVNNTIHRITDINKSGNYTTVPYDIDHNPNINLLLNIHKLLRDHRPLMV